MQKYEIEERILFLINYQRISQELAKHCVQHTAPIFLFVCATLLMDSNVYTWFFFFFVLEYFRLHFVYENSIDQCKILNSPQGDSLYTGFYAF